MNDERSISLQMSSAHTQVRTGECAQVSAQVSSRADNDDDDDGAKVRMAKKRATV